MSCLLAHLVSVQLDDGWSNGRDVGTWVKRIFTKYSLRLQDQPGSDTRVSLTDLELSLTDFLKTKATTAPQGQQQQAGSQAGGQHVYQQLMQHAMAHAMPPAPPPPPATSIATATAPPAAVTAEPAVAIDTMEAVTDDQEEEEEYVVVEEDGFGGLSNDFLQSMQSALESLGYDLTSSDIMQQLANNDNLDSQLLPLMMKSGNTEAARMVQMIKQWQKAIKEQLELERKLARKKQRPVWRCAVCGRYGCPVAPYIERYDEFDG